MTRPDDDAPAEVDDDEAPEREPEPEHRRGCPCELCECTRADERWERNK